MGINSLVESLKESGEDFEFYPTTQEIVDAIAPYVSGDLLDIGCGNGSFFAKLDNAVKSDRHPDGYWGKKYGIEKSAILAGQLPDDVFLIGTDFHEQNLIDKKMNFIWCNPPYSEYEEWMEKIILTGNADKIGMVVPERWKDNERIKEALSKRNMETETLGTYDFSDAERKARGKVELLLISGKKAHGWDTRYESTDPFDVWFDETFKISAQKEKTYDFTYTDQKKKDLAKESELVKGQNLAERLVELYNNDMQRLLETYRSIENIDAEVFSELKIDLKSVKEALKVKLKGLKSVYWNELFNRYDRITSRLTSYSINRITGKLNSNTQIDFTLDNIYQITMWVIRNSNKMYDEQIVSFFEGLVRPENISRYKSNRHWNDDSWRYAQEKFKNAGWSERDKVKKSLSHVTLEYRVVDIGWSNFETDWHGKATGEIKGETLEHIHDICKIGKCLGFDVMENSIPKDRYSARDCYINWGDFDIRLESGGVFANVKLYKNGNRHIKFNLDFIKRLNVEAGRLLGWLRDKDEAEEELGLSKDEVARMWGCNTRIRLDEGAKLLGLPMLEVA